MAVAPPLESPTATSLSPARRFAPRDAELSVVVVRAVEELAEHASALEDLAAAALEPNVFLEPWMLLPAVQAFAGGQALEFVLVYAHPRGRAAGPRTACGFFPLERQRHWKGLPIRLVRIWRHLHGVLGTPLLRADCAQECWAFFLTWLAQAPGGAAVLELPFVTGDGPFSQLLIDHGCQHGGLSFVAESFTRALFRPRGSSAEYLAAAQSGQYRRQLNRLERRLGEAGALRYAMLGADGDVDAWIGAFLELEARGWKGREGTALAEQEADRRFFHAFAREAFRRGRLHMLGLFLGDRPVALKCNLLAAPGAYAFKIAFDEAFARHSPGVLLEVFNIHRLHDDPRLAWMDSCAIHDHSMINRLWLDRRTIQTVLISTGRCPGDFLVSLLPALRWVKRKIFRPRPTAARGRY